MSAMRPPRYSSYPTAPALDASSTHSPAWAAVLASAVASALLLCGLAAYGLMESLDQYEERAVLLSQNLAAAVSGSLSANIEKVDIIVSAVASDLERQLRSGSIDLEAMREELAALQSGRAELDGIVITDQRGKGLLWVRAQLKLDVPNVDFSDREWFAAHRDNPTLGFHVTRPLWGPLAQIWYVSFSRRYRDAAGRFAGVVTASVPLSSFRRQLQAIDVGTDGAVGLRADDLGLIVRAQPDPRRAGTGDGERVGSQVMAPELRALLESGKLQGTLNGRSGLNGTGGMRVMSFKRLTAAPMLVTVGLGTEGYLADWRKEVRSTVVFCAGIVALYAFGCWLLMRALANNHRARQRIDLLAKVFENSGEAIMLTDPNHIIIDVNPAFTKQTGYDRSELIGQAPHFLRSERTSPEDAAAIMDTVRSRGYWRGEMWNRAKDGRHFPKWLSVTVLRDAHGAITHHIASSIDVTQVKEAEARMLHLAHHDTLTQLPNRVQLLEWLDRAIATARREGAELAMMFIDMDRFKNINDTLGHQVGDGLLIEVGQRLRSLVRETDLVARLGGDEFVLVIPDSGSRAAATATQVANKLMQALGEPYLVGDHELHSTPSIGIGMFPSDGDDADTLMKNADTAMYQAKAAGRNNFKFFTPAMNDARAERLALEVGLRVAIERGQLFLHYQPQVDMSTGGVLALEALVRWQHPTMGLIPPLKFIPVAEDTGLIESIGAWVLDQALAQVAVWRAQGHGDLRMAVNLSAHQLRPESFADQVARALQRHGLPGVALELEITESVAMSDPERTALLLRRLRDIGVALAIDDFGTGYSSLAYLKQLPLSCLKLDRSFVMDIEHDPNDAAICTATIQMAHSLGLAVVAEGVETATQLEFLRSLGCDSGQGYYFSRPQNAADCSIYLQAQSVRPEFRLGSSREGAAPGAQNTTPDTSITLA